MLVSTCAIPLLTELQCQTQGCANFTVDVQAALDRIHDGDTLSHIDLAVVSDRQTNWDDYFLPSVQVKKYLVNFEDFFSRLCWKFVTIFTD